MAVDVKNLPETDVAAKYQTFLGDRSPIYADISSTDYVPTVNIRAITSVGGTTIKVDMVTMDGAASGVQLPSGGVLSIINVTKVYKTGTDATYIYLWPRGAD